MCGVVWCGVVGCGGVGWGGVGCRMVVYDTLWVRQDAVRDEDRRWHCFIPSQSGRRHYWANAPPGRAWRGSAWRGGSRGGWRAWTEGYNGPSRRAYLRGEAAAEVEKDHERDRREGVGLIPS